MLATKEYLPTRLSMFFCAVFGLHVTADESGFSADRSFLDLNRDGIEDVFYEQTASGYYEFVDSNFDGKVDESHQFSSDDAIVRSKVDSDFDGLLETTIVYYQGSAYLSAVDANSDGLYDIFFFYNYGTLVKAIRLYTSASDSNKVGETMFRFGYPAAETLSDTHMTEEEFSEQFINLSP